MVFIYVTDPSPKEGDAANKYKHLEHGRVGSMLDVRGGKDEKSFEMVLLNPGKTKNNIVYFK